MRETLDDRSELSQKRLVIVGATGMVGGYAFRYALEHHAVTSVTAIVRRKLGIPHPKLSEVFQDFADCSALAKAVSGQDAAVFCLGAYTGAVSAAELRTITVGYTIEFARVLRASSPEAAFSFLSGKGTDPTGRTGHLGGFLSGVNGPGWERSETAATAVGCQTRQGLTHLPCIVVGI